jgi:hypothetical protein
MVLPGVQALFGFQLIAVFNTGFFEHLSQNERRVHLASILCVIAAISLVMAPAALHRQTQPERVTSRFLRVSSRLLMSSMVPLAIGTALDVYLVARIILNDSLLAIVVATATLIIFAAAWFIFPLGFIRSRQSDA